MKLDQLIVQHLYNSKSVTLQGIGTLHLDPTVHIPAEGEKNFTIPENAFSFEYNLKAGEDEALINFIVQQTRKIKPLATSDLESYSILAKQFLNIGKPLAIEGIGTIFKNQAGLYEFTPGNFVLPKIDDTPKPLKDKTEETVSFESEAPRKNNNRGLVLFGFLLLFVALVALGLYYFIFKTPTAKTETATEETLPLPVTDTLAKTDTITTIQDSLANITSAPVVKDSFNFKIVIKDYGNEVAANKAFAKLTSYGHKLIIVKVDSTKFQLAMPFTKPLGDTANTRDSLKKFFGGTPYIITQ